MLAVAIYRLLLWEQSSKTTRGRSQNPGAGAGDVWGFCCSPQHSLVCRLLYMCGTHRHGHKHTCNTHLPHDD